MFLFARVIQFLVVPIKAKVINCLVKSFIKGLLKGLLEGLAVRVAAAGNVFRPSEQCLGNFQFVARSFKLEDSHPIGLPRTAFNRSNYYCISPLQAPFRLMRLGCIAVLYETYAYNLLLLI